MSYENTGISYTRIIPQYEIDKLIKYTENIKELINKLKSKILLTNQEIEDYEEILDKLNTLVFRGLLDHFYNLNGLVYLKELIDCGINKIEIPALDIFRRVIQSNETYQNSAFELGFLKILMEKLVKENDSHLLFSIVFSILFLTSHNELITNNLIENENNIHIFLNKMQSFQRNRGLYQQTCRLFCQIIEQKKQFMDTLIKFNFIPLSVELMNGNEDLRHEDLLGLLIKLCEYSSEIKDNLFKQNPNLQYILKKKLTFFDGTNQFLEEVYLQEILDYSE